MKQIFLKGGGVAIVDDSDYDFINKWVWRKNTPENRKTSYACRGIAPSSMHRVIMGVTDPKIYVDHIDGNGLNNTRENLRLCNSFESARNKRKPVSGVTSKYKGVYYRHKEKIFQAHIKVNYKMIYLGRFKDEKEAAIAYNSAALIYHKEFACLNIIE